jgi:TRAP-type C4-dicarboxylate transport system substrate-binding protein
MKNKYFVFLLALIAFFAVGLTMSGSAMAGKKPIVIRLVVPSPAGDWPLTTVQDDFAKKFNARAKGEYKIEVYPGGALAKLPEYFDAVRVGAVEMAVAPWPMFTNLDPRLGVIETPFLFVSSQAASAACKPLVPLYDQILQEKFNAKGLALFNPGGVNLFSTKPIKTLADWKGLLVGCLSPPASALAKELGASPVTLMWTDTYESLQKKVVDANLQGSHGAVSTNIIDVTKYATMFFGNASWNGYSINLDVWKKMPPDIQKILQEEANAAAAWMNKNTNSKLVNVDVKAYKDKGVSVYYVPKAERDKWEKRVAPYRDKMVANTGEFGRKVKKIVDAVNKKYPYTEKGTH